MKFFYVRKKECCFKIFLWFKAFFFIGAGAGVGAGEKNTLSRSRSKLDRLRNTGSL